MTLLQSRYMLQWPCLVRPVHIPACIRVQHCFRHNPALVCSISSLMLYVLAAVVKPLGGRRVCCTPARLVDQGGVSHNNFDASTV
jgi:hypothetical protein